MSLPYAELLRAAFRVGIAPEVFWNLTPRELLLLTHAGTPAAAEPLRRDELEALLQQAESAYRPRAEQSGVTV